MENVKVSKGQEESIKKAIRDYATVAHIVKAKSKGEVFPDIYDHLNHLDLDTLIRALYIGYEVEQTREDKVREVIRSFCNGAIVSDWVIEDIKKIYEGVNDQ